MCKMPTVISAIVATCFSMTAHADPFQNGSFEDGLFANSTYSTLVTADSVRLSPFAQNIAHWTVDDAQIGWFQNNAYQLSASDGNRFLDLTGFVRNGYGGVKQTFDTVIGQAYKVSFDLGYSEQYGLNSIISVHVNGTPPSSNLFGILCCGAGANVWRPMEFEFTASSNATELKFSAAPDSRDYVGLDNVVVTAVTPVPEPETYAMMLAGLGLLGVMASRRKQKLSA